MYRKDLKESLDAVLNFEILYDKTFLITGASGLIASFLIDLLFFANEIMDAGIKVYALVRSKACAEIRFQPLLEQPAFRLVIQDVCDPIILKERADYIIHAAGDGYPGAFQEHPVETMLPAVMGSFQLLEYMKKTKGSRFLYVSSGEIYGSGHQKGLVETDSGYVDSMKSRSCYPSAKRAAETLCASYFAEYGLDIVVARPSHVYGPNSTEKDNRASAQFFRDVLSGRDVVLKSRGQQLRSYTYVADCVSALLTVLTAGVSGEAYNIANPAATATIAEFAETIARIGGKKCCFERTDETDFPEKTPISYAVLNSDKLQALGWQGSYSIQRGIRHTLESMLRQA